MMEASVLETKPLDKAPIADAVVLTERFHYLDSVRAYAMLLGVFLHAAMAYGSDIQHLWFWQDPGDSLLFEVTFHFIHMFRMEVFYLVAGFFAFYLIAKRGSKKFIKNRLVRLAVPFVMFLPLLTIAQMALIFYGVQTLEFKGDVMLLIDDAIKNPTGEPPPLEMGALWFIYYLLFFSVITVLVQKIRFPPLNTIMASILSRPSSLMWLPVLVVPGLLVGSDRPPLEFYLHLWPFLYYGLFFFLGWHIFNNLGFFDLLEKYKSLCLVSGIMLFCAYFYIDDRMTVAEILATNGYSDYSHQKLLEVCVHAWASFHLTAAFIGYGKSLFGEERTWSRYMSDASYWVYLVHVPVVMGIQMLLIDSTLSIFAKYLLVISATFGIAFITYEHLVRYTWIGAILNGRKTRN